MTALNTVLWAYPAICRTIEAGQALYARPLYLAILSGLGNGWARTALTETPNA